MLRSSAEFGAIAVMLLLTARSAPAQAIGQGFELERAGQYQQAASVYFTTLRGDPTNLAALLGLERVLPSLHRLPDLLPPTQRAVAASPRHAALRALLLRTYVALNEPDSARAVALRWAAEQPRDEAPYREWAIALGDARKPDEARQVFLAGRRALGRPDAFGVELGELLQRLGDWEGAAREWAVALTAAPAQLPNAASSLGDAPHDQRERIVRAITGEEGGGGGAPGPLARRLAAELLLDWDQPAQAWTLFEPTVATPSADAARALRRFADLASGRTTNDAHRVRALALARYAEMIPEPLAGRARADAARAFLAAGDRAAARSVLEQVAGDPSAPPEAQALAQAALVAALIDDGQLAEASARLATDGRLSGDDRAALRLRLARARVVRGDFDLADSALADDSSVDALAAAGWIALYRGRLDAAQTLFRQAGPYAGERRDATERTAMLALLQQVRIDPFPELGGALLTLARGDSIAAVQSLRRAAARLETGGGGGGVAEVLLIAARVAARLDSTQQRIALALFDEIVRADGNGAAAPAAELEWARLLLRRQNTAEAIAHLERLILSHPESAVVPEARRELERAKGAIPKS
jgi:tetratricopeptide (TPR) repeat protein